MTAPSSLKNLASSDQIRALQTARRRAGLSDDDWRARIEREAGVASTKLVPAHLVGRLLDGLNGGSKPVHRNAEGARNLTGPYSAKLRALWLTGYNLGVVKVKTDAALLAFVERQTGIEHTRFLRDAGSAKRAIEGLKSWIAREADFVWPSDSDIVETKRAVLTRQWAMLIECGSVVTRFTPETDLPNYLSSMLGTARNGTLSNFDDAQLDEAAKRLGDTLRRWKARAK